jgi:hypothetical protein
MIFTSKIKLSIITITDIYFKSRHKKLGTLVLFAVTDLFVVTHAAYILQVPS